MGVVVELTVELLTGLLLGGALAVWLQRAGARSQGRRGKKPMFNRQVADRAEVREPLPERGLFVPADLVPDGNVNATTVLACNAGEWSSVPMRVARSVL